MAIATELLELTAPVPVPGRDATSDFGDERDYFTAITRETPRDLVAEDAFIAAKQHLILTQPGLEPADRQLALRELDTRIGPEALRQLASENDPPVPGGVGYGFFYNPAFKMGFATGTSIAFDFICPTKPGGNVSDFLYITAMNRAGRGIEAFVSYYQQTDFHFKVFDWARTDHWQIDIPFANLGNYISSKSAHGTTYQTMGVQNLTQQISATHWRNEAWLWNRVASRWDLIYRFDYAGTHAEQVGGFTGSWGPIVETFQPLYMNTKNFGFLNTQLANRNAAGTWESWQYLSPSNSHVRTDNVGFHVLFIDPNYAFAVYSTP